MAKLEKEKFLEMYEKMVRIRKFELKVEELHLEGKLYCLFNFAIDLIIYLLYQ